MVCLQQRQCFKKESVLFTYLVDFFTPPIIRKREAQLLTTPKSARIEWSTARENSICRKKKLKVDETMQHSYNSC